MNHKRELLTGHLNGERLTIFNIAIFDPRFAVHDSRFAIRDCKEL